MGAVSLTDVTRRRVHLPPTAIPEGRMVELPGRGGSTYVTDTPGPSPAERGFVEFRSTSPWAIGQAIAALGHHHSRPWLGRIDVPTAAVVMMRSG